ncbi:MAG: DUF4911 domain-containing protein [Smithella sp.]|nr:DUF4911 domain-containing protein [Smithella sp.]
MIKRFFQLQRKDIALVQFIIEGYSRMATVKTVDSRVAVIQISIMPDFVSEMSGLIDYLKGEYKLKEINDSQEKN